MQRNGLNYDTQQDIILMVWSLRLSGKISESPWLLLGCLIFASKAGAYPSRASYIPPLWCINTQHDDMQHNGLNYDTQQDIILYWCEVADFPVESLAIFRLV